MAPKGEVVLGDTVNLQDAFSKFRLERQRKRQDAKKSEAAAAAARSKDPEAHAAHLRKKFIATARKYFGVPYAQRYHEAENCACEGCTETGRQLFHEPKFLDCCALLRQIVFDMRDEFGFTLPRFNQAYQFDTLTERVASHEELQPGDIIFWSGKYHNPKFRTYFNDMTHVEIFVGGRTGEGTIGSRAGYKWVAEHDSFHFTPRHWAVKEIYFCRLDPWLRGELKPAHPELWTRKRKDGLEWVPLDPTKHSIFNDDSQQGQQQDFEDEAAECEA